MTPSALGDCRTRNRVILAIRRCQWREELRRPFLIVVEGHSEGRGHHTDHDLLPAFDIDGPADRRSIAPEVALPERVSDQRDIVCARYVFLRKKVPAEHRRDAERTECFLRHLCGVHALRVARARDALRIHIIDAHRIEHVRLVGEQLVFVVGHPRSGALEASVPHDDRVCRIAERQGVEQGSVHDAEERRSRADAECQRQRGRDGESG